MDRVFSPASQKQQAEVRAQVLANMSAQLAVSLGTNNSLLEEIRDYLKQAANPAPQAAPLVRRIVAPAINAGDSTSRDLDLPSGDAWQIQAILTISHTASSPQAAAATAIVVSGLLPTDLFITAAAGSPVRTAIEFPFFRDNPQITIVNNTAASVAEVYILFFPMGSY